MGTRQLAGLDRAAILGAALRLVDRDGLANLNMRALASDLGVGTMSLYHYVPNKDALLDGVVEAVLSEIAIPASARGTWQQRAAQMARSFREVALRHPECVPLLVTRPFTTPAALRPCETALDVLASAGLDVEQALIAFRTIVAYVLGFVTMEASGFFGGVGHDRDPQELSRLGLPRLGAVLPHLDGRNFGRDFDGGLALILSGISSTLGPR